MSEIEAPRAAPYVLDASAVIAVARADSEVTRAILNLDARGRALVVPALVIAAASLDSRSPDADRALLGLELLASVSVAPLEGAEQALRLARVISRTGLDPWDAHAAAVADAGVCPILTLDTAKWRQHAHDLDEPLHFIEIADPGEGEE